MSVARAHFLFSWLLGRYTLSVVRLLLAAKADTDMQAHVSMRSTLMLAAEQACKHRSNSNTWRKAESKPEGKGSIDSKSDLKHKKTGSQSSSDSDGDDSESDMDSDNDIDGDDLPMRVGRELVRAGADPDLQVASVAIGCNARYEFIHLQTI